MSSDAIGSIYSMQIVVLVLCIVLFSACMVMIWRSRAALNGTARSLLLLSVLLISLMVLLIMRRLDILFGILDDTLGLSTLVVFFSFAIACVFLSDISYVYHQRHFYMAWRKAREEKQAEYERMRQRDEAAVARRNWDDEAVKRWL